MADSTELALVIKKLGESSVEDKVVNGAVALMNVIPVAGGVVASIIGQAANDRKTKKICNVLSDLNERLEAHQADPLKHLNEDQVIEVVHDTLQTVATTSDQEKIAKLRNGLCYAFLKDDPFERKQLYLQVLRGATSLELAVISWVYGSDPFVVRIGQPDSYGSQLPDGGLVVRASGAMYPELGYWSPGETTDTHPSQELVKHLASQLGASEAVAMAAARLVDSKGLAALSDHLHDTGPCRVYRWSTAAGYPSLIVSSPINSSIVQVSRETPVEASRTEFGGEFLRFCQG